MSSQTLISLRSILIHTLSTLDFAPMRMIRQTKVEKILFSPTPTQTNPFLDAIPAKILKLAAHIIAPSLTHIFNLSLQSGIYVNDWKRARVTPIFKSEDKSKCENYRPISILSIVSKVFEKEVFRQMYTYVNESNLLSKYQSGFRPQHSTLSALIKICDDILNNMDEGKINCTRNTCLQQPFAFISKHCFNMKYFGLCQQ